MRLKEIVPEYGKYIKFLIDNDILQSDNHYIPGEKCKAYWFTPEYDGRFEYRPVTSAWMINRIEKSNSHLHKTKSHTEQIKYLNRITIDDGAMDVINTMMDVNRFNSAMAQYELIRSGALYAKIDKTSGRLHTNITNLDSELRPFLRVDGQKLSNVYIKTRHPYFTIIPLTNPHSAAPYARATDFKTLLMSLDSVDTMDSKMFIYLVRTGRMYEYLMANGFKGDRDRSKRKFFIVLFGSPMFHNYIPESQIFESLFPNVFERIQQLKGDVTSRSADKFKSFKRFAILLQTLEVHAVLDCVSKRIGRERPDVVILTIHDSVMTGFLTNDIDYVHGVMMDELSAFVGYAPSLKIENAPE